MPRLLLLLLITALLSCNDSAESKGPSYIPPTIDRRGVFRKGHIRKQFSTEPDAVKNRNRNSYYYKTRGKYRRK